MSTLSTHVLDVALGCPAAGVAVRLESADGAVIDRATTDEDGRVAGLGGPDVAGGVYRLVFDSGGYHRTTGQTEFFPEVTVAFTVTEARAHHHVPLLLAPFAYSTYRGS